MIYELKKTKLHHTLKPEDLTFAKRVVLPITQQN